MPREEKNFLEASASSVRILWIPSDVLISTVCTFKQISNGNHSTELFLEASVPSVKKFWDYFPMSDIHSLYTQANLKRQSQCMS